jgi:hypothetical protein
MAMSCITLDDLHQAVAALDSKKQFYRGKSYGWTIHNTLDDHWWIFMPYGNWSSSLSAPIPSPFEDAIRLALTPPAAKQVADSGDYFIDLSHLGTADANFFQDSNANGQTIINSLSNLLQQSSGKVTIRYLVGNPTPVTAAGDGFLNALFDAGLPNAQNVTVCFGLFSPDFAPSSPASASTAAAPDLVVEIWNWLKELIDDIETISADLKAELIEIYDDLKGWIERFLASTTPAFSWNHSKIVAINGEKLVTAGANFWNEYETGDQWTWLFDCGMTINGGAALTAHRFLDQLWRYVGQPSPTDTTSFSEVNNLSNSINGFVRQPAPSFGLTPPPYPGTTSVLSVARNGMWPVDAPMFSIQMFDALRDFLGNLIATVAETKLGDAGFEVTAMIASRLGDDDPGFRGLLDRLDVAPAAWATRYARNHAIKNAQKGLRFTQQKFVMPDLYNNSTAFQELVSDINTKLNINWNGFFWPLDTMLAFGSALSNFSNNSIQAPALQIVCSYYGANDASEGYQDGVSGDTFKTRLKGIMGGMKAQDMISPSGDPGQIVELQCDYAVIAPTPPPNQQSAHANHAKVVVVDDALCYVGSDNAYPSYNTEFGLWHGDTGAIAHFVQDYWTGLWAFASEQ